MLKQVAARWVCTQLLQSSSGHAAASPSRSGENRTQHVHPQGSHAGELLRAAGSCADTGDTPALLDDDLLLSRGREQAGTSRPVSEHFLALGTYIRVLLLADHRNPHGPSILFSLGVWSASLGPAR